MSQVSKIEIPVEEATAAALTDARRREAVGRLIDRLVRPGADDPLIALFERISAEARDAGLVDYPRVAALRRFQLAPVAERAFHRDAPERGDLDRFAARTLRTRKRRAKRLEGANGTFGERRQFAALRARHEREKSADLRQPQRRRIKGRNRRGERLERANEHSFGASGRQRERRLERRMKAVAARLCGNRGHALGRDAGEDGRRQRVTAPGIAPEQAAAQAVER